MAPLDVTTTVLLCTMLFYAFMSPYVISMVLCPLLMAAINGVIDLARQALQIRGSQANTVSTSGSDIQE